MASRRVRTIAGHVVGTDVAHSLPLTACSVSAAPISRSTSVVTAGEVAALVKSGDHIVGTSFVGCGSAEALLRAVRVRFDETGEPRDLHLTCGIAVGDSKGRGFDHLSKPGILKSLKYAWLGTSPGLQKLIANNDIAAWNLPFGCISQLFRSIAANPNGPGLITHVGLDTFVDPREQGGKKNATTTEAAVELCELNGQTYLRYKPQPIQWAFIKATTADEAGNISLEREPLFLDALNQAFAARNSGGRVAVQVERVVARGSIPTRMVHIPGALVDFIVVAKPDDHWQTLASPIYDGSLSGELRKAMSAADEMSMDERRILAHRAMLEMPEGKGVVNLGVGVPEGVAKMYATHGHAHVPHATEVIMSTEAGAVGGFPTSGLLFGPAHNAACHFPSSTMIDVYHGGLIDLSCLGMGEVDSDGNVNVSMFSGRMPGCGGFIDISQNCKKLILMGSMTSGGLKVKVGDGKLEIVSEGKHRKFVKSVQEKTFSAKSRRGRTVLYVTERAVFELTDEGVELVEVAPGIDIDTQVLPLMDFKPIIRKPRIMDARIFQ